MRVWFVNADFATGPRRDRPHLAHLAAKADVILVVEATNIVLADLLPEGWATDQDTTSLDRAGSAICWNTATVFHQEDQLFLGTRPFIRGRRIKMMNRWIHVAVVTCDDLTVRALAAHYAPRRFSATWAIFTRRLKRILARPDQPVVLGTDANQDIHGLAERLGLKAHGIGIVGVLTVPGLEVTDVEIDRFGLEHGATDHPTVGVTITSRVMKLS